MNHISAESHSGGAEQVKGDGNGRQSLVKTEVIVKSVVTAVAVSSIIHASKGAMAAFAGYSFIMFSLGIAAGYLTHKHRKKLFKSRAKPPDKPRILFFGKK